MNASNSARLALPKPRPKAKPARTAKPRTRIPKQSAARRKESALVGKVFKALERRDGDCRIATWAHMPVTGALIGICGGDPQPAHLSPWRRSRTRGQASEDRHSSKTIIRLCAWHHRRYDRHEFDLALNHDGGDGVLWPIPFVKGETASGLREMAED